MQYLGVKFCGNCNPCIDGLALAQELAAELGVQVVPWDDDRAEALVVINGCEVGCIQRPALLHLNGCSVERSACGDVGQLRQQALEQLRSLIGQQSAE